MNAMFAIKSNVGNKEDENYLVALFVHLCYSQCPFLYIVVTLRSTSRQQKNTGYNNNSCFSCLADPSLWLNVPGSRSPAPLWWWFRHAFCWPLSPPSPPCQYCCPCPHRTPGSHSLKIVKSKSRKTRRTLTSSKRTFLAGSLLDLRRGFGLGGASRVSSLGKVIAGGRVVLFSAFSAFSWDRYDVFIHSVRIQEAFHPSFKNLSQTWLGD